MNIRQGHLFLVLCWLLLTMPMLSGCSEVKQINRITFVTALGIDKSEQGVKVHALLAIPGRFASLSPGSGSTVNKSPNYILTEEGKDIADALFKMKRKNARDIQFGHTKVILFSDAIAKEGLEPYMDIFMRRSEFQPIAWIALTEGTTKAILKATPEIPDSPADLFVDVFSQTGSDTLEILPIYMYEFYSLSVEPGQSPYAMFIRDIKEGNHISISKLGLFRKDKLVGSLNPEETMYLQILQNSPHQNTMVSDGETTTLTVTKYNTKLEVDPKRISIRTRIEADIDEHQKAPLEKPEQIRQLEQEMNERIKQKMSRLVEKLQDLHVDPVGFGNTFRIHQTGKSIESEEWTDRLFPKLPVELTVDTKIVRRGTIE